MPLPTFVLEQAARIASNRGHVIILSKYPRPMLDELTATLGTAQIERVRKSNGAEGIELHNGGRINIYRRSNELRGISTDLAIVPLGLSHDEVDDVIMALDPLNSGDIVGYY